MHRCISCLRHHGGEPLTFSIALAEPRADSFTVVKVGREIPRVSLSLVLTVLFILRYIYLAAA